MPSLLALEEPLQHLDVDILDERAARATLPRASLPGRFGVGFADEPIDVQSRGQLVQEILREDPAAEANHPPEPEPRSEWERLLDGPELV